MVAVGSRLLMAVCAALLIAGCGGGGHDRQVAASGAHSGSSAVSGAADPAKVRVIKGWSDALRRGDVRGAARYFAVPSEMVNGVGPTGQLLVIRIGSAAEAEIANQTLPCGARLVSAHMHGRFIDALFVLTGRRGPGGTNCGKGRGDTARTEFAISEGRIVEWIRAPSEPGDSAHAAPGARSGTPGPVD